MVFLPFQLATRPWGIFILIGSQLVIWMIIAFCYIAKCCTDLTMPPVLKSFVCLFFNRIDETRPFQFSQKVAIYRLTALLRLATLAVAWAVLMWQLFVRPELAAHLLEPSNAAILAVAALGGAGYPVFMLQQLWAGRWSQTPLQSREYLAVASSRPRPGS